MRIRTRLLVVVFGVWVAAAAGFGLLTWNLHNQKLASELRQLSDLAEGINTLVERELDKRVVLARTLASSRAVREGDFPRFHEEATAATSGSDNWALLVEPGLLKANTLAPYSPAAVPRTRPRPLIDTGAAIVFVPKGPVSGEQVATVIVPVPGMAPQKYNVGVAFKPSSLQKLLPGGSSPSLISVVDDQQIIMARSRDPERWIGQSASPAFKKRINEGGVGFAKSTTLDGTPSLTYLTRPNGYGWSVVLAFPQAQLSAAAWESSAKAISASGLFLFMLLAIAVYVARAISSAVERLSSAAARLGNNEIPEQLHSGVKEFDAVAAALHAAGVKAHDATASLERRVEEAVRAEADAQAKLQHSQKLELVGRLTAGVAHDFNNLLQTITTAHQFLSRRVTGDKEQKTISAAVRATSKAADLVRQMMLLGRVQTLNPTLVNIADALLKGHELTSKAVGASISLTAALEPGLPPVYVDAGQFDMALLNLVFNSRDALPAGGNIHISARMAAPHEVEGVESGAFLCVEVTDDGAGMSRETMAKAFDPFFTTKPVGAGTGLGLAQVHSFTLQSGGNIKLASEPGKGTRVTLYLPVAREDQFVPARHEDTSPSMPALPSLRLLMVEDDALVASVVASTLRALGHDVHVCHSADEAMRLLNTNEGFDALFTDVVMPGSMSGVELVDWAMERWPGMAVVVATGYADNVNQLTVPVIRKPYDMETLQRTLAEVLDGATTK